MTPKPPHIVAVTGVQKRPKYVIIGGAGYLGASIIEYMLLRTLCDIVVVDVKPEQEFETVKFDKKFVTYIVSSYRAEGILDEVLEGCDSVFHLASKGHRGHRSNDLGYIWDFNVCGTDILLKKCEEYGVKRFVYASSIASVFTGKPYVNLDETVKMPSAEECLTMYSYSKGVAESLVLEFASETFKTASLRFRAIYGPEDDFVIGRISSLVQYNFNKTMFSAEKEESVSQNSSVRNCAQAFFLADRALETTDINGEAYFITDEEILGQYSFFDPLVTALGGSLTPSWLKFCRLKGSIPYIVKMLKYYEAFCYRWRLNPVVTHFEFILTLHTNTYNLDKAKKQLGYVPEPGNMVEVAAYQAKMYKNRHGFRNFSFLIIAGLAYFFFFYLHFI